MNIKSTIGILRLVGILEGLSFLVLLLIAMPLKYIFHLPETVKIVGTIHGALFVIYLLMLFIASREYRFKLKEIAIGIIASVIPLGTFYADKKVFKAYA